MSSRHHTAHHILWFDKTVANHFLECVPSKRLFATYAESVTMFVFSNSCWKILLQSSGCKSFTCPQVSFLNQNFTFRNQHIQF